MKILKPIKENLNGIIRMKGIEMKRHHFSIVSNKTTEAIEKFGINTVNPVYLEFCPMAFDNKGGFWISKEKEIKNPYFGDKMLKCGEVKKTFDKKQLYENRRNKNRKFEMLWLCFNPQKRNFKVRRSKECRY